MVVGTVGAVAVIATGGAAAIAGAAAGAGVGTGAAVAGTSQAVAVASGVGLSSGAIAGGSVAAAGGTSVVTGSVAGALAGGAAGAGVGGSGAGLGAFIVGTGGWGLLAIGTSEKDDNTITYDCWKPVLRDSTLKPPNGMFLDDMLRHPNIIDITVTRSDIPELPNMVLENRWNERFLIQYVILTETGKMMGHAKRL